jgi:spore coat polysaccharide biosynthesis predicted glycosyltransferase SpsG
MPGALLVHDEGPGAGLGHRRRCEALAAALTDRGVACRLQPTGAGGRLVDDVVVVDSYRERADEMEIDAGLLVALDDLRRDLDVDVLVDPSPGADESVHRRAAQVLAGVRYSLVPRARPPTRPVSAGAPASAVLVTTGATDAAGTGARIAGELHALDPDVEVRLVVGAWGAQEVPDGVVAVHAPAGLTGELAAAPLVVTAGGVTMLEACALGRAVVAVVISANQRVAVESLAAAGAVRAATTADAAEAAVALIADPATRARLGEAAAAAVDGDGAARVADAILRHVLSGSAR